MCIRSYLYLLIALTSTVCACAQATLTTNTQTDAYLNQYRTDFARCLLDARSERLLGYWADDVRLMTESQRTMVGRTSALSYFNALLGRFTVKAYTRIQKELLDLGKQVVDDGLFDMTIVLKKTGQTYHLKGKYLTLWQKYNGDKLTVITDSWNYNHWLDIADQFRFAEVSVVDVALQAHLPINSPIRFELAALNRLMEKTIAEHDANLWAQFYSDEGILLAQHDSIYQGRQAIDAYIAMHTKDLPIFEKLDVRNDRVDDLGLYVIEYASHIANWRNGESSGIGLGKDLRIWRREKNGSLKIFRHIGMYD
ncbi:Cif family virulence factor [Spirosoma aerolatum]|uniref:nuclear transport factor 2 family protein n=1 Tax=Spirosoma aerolatum TaxID=1211326 RepID=UPI0009AD76E0|nr:nuclear transport factor 2 family protein [Spirosoma aerolatum]